MRMLGIPSACASNTTFRHSVFGLGKNRRGSDNGIDKSATMTRPLRACATHARPEESDAIFKRNTIRTKTAQQRIAHRYFWADIRDGPIFHHGPKDG
jgi:hypothetical protein